MSRAPFGPQLQPHVYTRRNTRACVRRRRAASVRHTPTGVALALIAATLTRTTPLAAQQPAPQSQPPQIAPYKLPVVVLIQPPPGATVPADRPVVVFRFTQGEAADPIDLRSFAIAVDGEDRTGHFQLAALPPTPNAGAAGTGEAWGPMTAPNGGPIAVGAHQLTARICSSPGACGEVSTTVLVTAPTESTAPRDASSTSRKRRVLEALLGAAKKLLTP